MNLTLDEARRLAVHAQGLGDQAVGPTKQGKTSALEVIRHLGYVQIDTISVVERAHHHVLWSRAQEYSPEHLKRLQREKKVFEYWFHAASYLPIEDYRYCLPRMKAHAEGKAHWFRTHKKDRDQVLARIRAEGPLQARDFEGPKKRGGWFHWKPAKRALEQLFMAGELMVGERRGFQKVYDLRERVLPANLDTSFPSELEHAQYLIQTTLRSHGLALEPEMRYLKTIPRASFKKALSLAIESGDITEVRVERLDDLVFYARTKDLENFAGISRSSSPLHILSPFDPHVIQRKRTKTLFGFDYQIECYVPEAKRKFGYFSLPITADHRFLGRMDAKADRKTGILQILSLHLETKLDRPLKERLHKKIEEFAKFNGCEKKTGLE
jgi:uncharacterized protein YcaQ